MRFLKRRHHRFWFQIAVPKALWDHYGRRVILENLDTSDLAQAQSRRWYHVAKWKDAFRRASKGEKLKPEEVEAEAQAVYRRVLMGLKEVEPTDLGDGDDPVMTTLKLAHSEMRDALEDGPVTYMASSFDPDADPDDVLVSDIYPFVENEIAQFIEGMGAVEIDDAGRHEIAQAFLCAHIRALETAIARRRGLEAPPVGVLNTNYRGYEPISANGAQGTAPFSQLVRDYLGAVSDRWTQKTRQQNNTAYRLFQDHIEDKPLAEVTRGDTAKFFDRLARLRPRWASSPRAKGLPLNELLIECGASQGEPGLTEKTLARYRSALYGLFTWAIDRELYHGPNPFAVSSNGASRSGSDRDTSWQPYEVEELNVLLSGLKVEARPNAFTHDGALAWITVIALYSGARLEEIAGLRTADIREEDGIPYFDLRNSQRRLKTRAARRRVPIHSELIRRLGKAGDGEDARRGKYVGDRFNTYRRNCGITRPQVSFHSLRANASTALDRAGVPENHAAQILGHAIRSLSYGVYSGGLDIEGLQRVVDAIEYPGLKLDS
jgi:integrase